MFFVRVVLDVPLDQCFDYRASRLFSFGERVRVSFRGKLMCALVWESFEDASRLEVPIERLLPVEASLSDLPRLPESWRALVEFASNYYCHPLGQTAFAALPPAFRSPVERLLLKERYFEPIAQPPLRTDTQKQLWQAVCAGRAYEHLRQLHRGATATLSKWKKGEWIRECTRALDEVASIPMLTPSKIDRPNAHTEGEKRLRFRRFNGDKRAFSQQKLTARNRYEKRVFSSPQRVVADRSQGAHEPTIERALTSEQAQVFEQLSPLGAFSVDVLHGITGSGKTELYLHRVAAALRSGLQALILVPEISLTPQLEARFRTRFSSSVLVTLHSGVSDTERVNNWLKAQSGQADIVLGTRLSVFVPLPRLGVLIVDEEHDASLKQQEGLLYSARDLAVWRAKYANIPIVLGSATPSLETLWHAKTGRYRYFRLTSRATGLNLPTVRILDIRQQALMSGMSVESLQALSSRLEAGEMSMVFINRRGYAPALTCDQCGWILSCPNCSARLVFHQFPRGMRCHHCGHREGIPHHCPSCGNLDIRGAGQGTQQIEEMLRAQFPQARMIRIDRDTVRSQRDWAKLYERILAHEFDILLGTQMLAKGHDFPLLTLVVMLNVDGVMFSVDYRANETAFANLLQVAGRAGRARSGEVLIQTTFPMHPLFQALTRHDFDAFSEYLLNERRSAGFPPFVFQALLRADAPNLALAIEFLDTISWTACEGVWVFDAVPSSMQRLANRERAQRLIQAETRAALHRVLWHLRQQLPEHARQFRGVRWALERDPLSV